jgi:uncharacterized OsmC-like protein
MASQPNPARVINVVNVNELFRIVDTVKQTPGVAKFKFRIRNQWLDGGHNRSTVSGYDAGGAAQEHQKMFVLDADEPPMLLGKDLGANPVEYLLHALAACVTTSMVYHAAAKGIEIEEVESALEGGIDLRGFLNLDPSIRKGYESIRITFRIKANATEQEIRDLAALGPQFSPVYDTITKGVPVTVTAVKA